MTSSLLIQRFDSPQQVLTSLLDLAQGIAVSSGMTFCWLKHVTQHISVIVLQAVYISLTHFYFTFLFHISISHFSFTFIFHISLSHFFFIFLFCLFVRN